MTTTRKGLNRRRFLMGAAGAALALPFLEYFRPSAARASSRPTLRAYLSLIHATRACTSTATAPSHRSSRRSNSERMASVRMLAAL